MLSDTWNQVQLHDTTPFNVCSFFLKKLGILPRYHVGKPLLLQDQKVHPLPLGYSGNQPHLLHRKIEVSERSSYINSRVRVSECRCAMLFSPDEIYEGGRGRGSTKRSLPHHFFRNMAVNILKVRKYARTTGYDLLWTLPFWSNRINYRFFL